MFDLDGVVRLWDAPAEPLAEDVRRVRFDPVFLSQVVVGKMTDEEWRDAVAAQLGEDAVRDWYDSAGRVDEHMLAVVQEVRASRKTALLTNATTRLPRDLATLGLDGGRFFDAVFNSAELGIAKPDPEVFRLVCSALEVAPGACVFVDDTPGHVDSARACGLRAFVYQGVEPLRDVLRSEGVLP